MASFLLLFHLVVSPSSPSLTSSCFLFFFNSSIVSPSRFSFVVPRLESLFSARGRHFAPSNLRAWKNYPCNVSSYEMAYFSSIFFKFCALHWPLRAWQFACARKIFSVHYILSSLVSSHHSFIFIGFSAGEGAASFNLSYKCDNVSSIT